MLLLVEKANNHSTDQKYTTFCLSFPFFLCFAVMTKTLSTNSNHQPEWIVKSPCLCAERSNPKNTHWRLIIIQKVFLLLDHRVIISLRWSLLTSTHHYFIVDNWASQCHWTRWIQLWEQHVNWKWTRRLQLLVGQIRPVGRSLLPLPCLNLDFHFSKAPTQLTTLTPLYVE